MFGKYTMDPVYLAKVRQVKRRTGARIWECTKALDDNHHDVEAAVDALHAEAKTSPGRSGYFD